jgi:hypothetical protein
VALVCTPGPAAGQNGGGGLELLTAVPESPAFVFLGASPTKVTRPGSVRDFGAALISGINADGKVQQGIALEATPWVYVPGLSITLDDYRGNWLKYVLANSQLSLGTARAAGDSATTDLALGLRFTLWDAGDPMRHEEFADDVAARLRKCLPDSPDADPAEVDACVDEQMRQAYAEFSGARWNSARAALGLASGVSFVNSELKNSEYAGFQAWLVGAYPLTRYGQILAQVTFMDQPALADQPDFTEWTYGGRLLAGSSWFNGFLEVVGESRSSDAALDDSNGRWSTGLELRVASKLWLSAGLGGLFALQGEEKTFVVVNVRWGINKSARLDELRQRPSP